MKSIIVNLSELRRRRMDYTLMEKMYFFWIQVLLCLLVSIPIKLIII